MPGGNSPKSFQLEKKFLHQMALLIKPPVTAALKFGTFSGRNGRLAAAVMYIINQLAAVISAVGRDTAVFYIYMLRDRNGKVNVVALSLADHYADGIAVCICGCMNLCAGTAPAVPDFSRGDCLSGRQRCADGPGRWRHRAIFPEVRHPC